MNPPEREPTSDELLAMAYADGELPGDERTAFERRVEAEPALARSVAEYRALEVLAREMAPPEPADHEWARLELDPLHRSGTMLGTFLVAAGGGGLALWGAVAVARSGLDLVPKTCLLAVIAGLAALLLTTVQGRLRVLPYDPYRKVKR